jgi:hypothetical protein
MEFPVTAVGTPGNGGAYVDFKIPDHTYKTWLPPDELVDWQPDFYRALFAFCHQHADFGGPIMTENKSVLSSTIEVTPHTPVAAVDQPQLTSIKSQLSPSPGQSYARPRDRKLNNPNTFIVTGAKVYGGMAVGLRPDGKVERVYEVGNVLFPRINYVHSLLGIVNEDAEVGEVVTVRDTDSVEERVYDLIPGAEYYPNYSSVMAKGSDHERWITTVPPTITSADSLDRIKLGKAATKDQLDLSFPQWKMYEYQANENIGKGQVVGLMANGKIQLVFCEANGDAKPQLDGVHSVLGLAKEYIASGDWGEVVTIDKSLQMPIFPYGLYNPLPGTGLTKGTNYYVDYRDATIKEFGTYSNHPDNIIGIAVQNDIIRITAKLPIHQTYSPQWDLTTTEYPYPTYCPVRTSPYPDEYFLAHDSIDAAEQYDGQVINSLVHTNVTPVRNLEQGTTVYFDDINIILEESDGFLLEDGVSDLLAEDGTNATTSSIGKLIIESEFLLYEDLINTERERYNSKMNIYSRHDAKYIVGDFTTETFNIHNRGNKYFPEGILDAVAQHIVLE